jgi:hypothetical protein
MIRPEPSSAMQGSMSLKQWLRYDDRNTGQYNQFHRTEISVTDFHENQDGVFDQPAWRKEEWLIRSAITPIHAAAAVADLARSPDYLEFEQGWSHTDKFDFGRHRRIGDADIYPISDIYMHPITKRLCVSPSSDFCRYHALEEREPGKYFHPVAEILVAQCSVIENPIFDPTPKVVIHRDFLRDFLSAASMSLTLKWKQSSVSYRMMNFSQMSLHLSVHLFKALKQHAAHSFGVDQFFAEHLLLILMTSHGIVEALGTFHGSSTQSIIKSSHSSLLMTKAQRRICCHLVT